MMRPGWTRFAVGQLLATLALAASASAQQPDAGAPPPGDPALAIQHRDEWRHGRAHIYMDDFGELGRSRAANARLKAPAAGENRVVFLGDSITDVWALATYFPGKPYVNRGIGGETTPQLPLRFRPDVVALG